MICPLFRNDLGARFLPWVNSESRDIENSLARVVAICTKSAPGYSLRTSGDEPQCHVNRCYTVWIVPFTPLGKNPPLEVPAALLP